MRHNNNTRASSLLALLLAAAITIIVVLALTAPRGALAAGTTTKICTGGTLTVSDDTFEVLSIQQTVNCNVTLARLTVSNIVFASVISGTNITVLDTVCTSSALECVAFSQAVTSAGVIQFMNVTQSIEGSTMSTPSFIEHIGAVSGINDSYIVRNCRYSARSAKDSATASLLNFRDTFSASPNARLSIEGSNMAAVLGLTATYGTCTAQLLIFTKTASGLKEISITDSVANFSTTQTCQTTNLHLFYVPSTPGALDNVVATTIARNVLCNGDSMGIQPSGLLNIGFVYWAFTAAFNGNAVTTTITLEKNILNTTYLQASDNIVLAGFHSAAPINGFLSIALLGNTITVRDRLRSDSDIAFVGMLLFDRAVTGGADATITVNNSVILGPKWQYGIDGYGGSDFRVGLILFQDAVSGLKMFTVNNNFADLICYTNVSPPFVGHMISFTSAISTCPSFVLSNNDWRITHPNNAVFSSIAVSLLRFPNSVATAGVERLSSSGDKLTGTTLKTEGAITFCAVHVKNTFTGIAGTTIVSFTSTTIDAGLATTGAATITTALLYSEAAFNTMKNLTVTDANVTARVTGPTADLNAALIFFKVATSGIGSLDIGGSTKNVLDVATNADAANIRITRIVALGYIGTTSSYSRIAVGSVQLRATVYPSPSYATTISLLFADSSVTFTGDSSNHVPVIAVASSSIEARVIGSSSATIIAAARIHGFSQKHYGFSVTGAQISAEVTGSTGGSSAVVAGVHADAVVLDGVVDVTLSNIRITNASLECGTGAVCAVAGAYVTQTWSGFLTFVASGISVRGNITRAATTSVHLCGLRIPTLQGKSTSVSNVTISNTSVEAVEGVESSGGATAFVAGVSIYSQVSSVNTVSISGVTVSVPHIYAGPDGPAEVDGVAFNSISLFGHGLRISDVSVTVDTNRPSSLFTARGFYSSAALDFTGTSGSTWPLIISNVAVSSPTRLLSNGDINVHGVHLVGFTGISTTSSVVMSNVTVDTAFLHPLNNNNIVVRAIDFIAAPSTLLSLTISQNIFAIVRRFRTTSSFTVMGINFAASPTNVKDLLIPAAVFVFASRDTTTAPAATTTNLLVGVRFGLNYDAGGRVEIGGESGSGRGINVTAGDIAGSSTSDTIRVYGVMFELKAHGSSMFTDVFKLSGVFVKCNTLTLTNSGAITTVAGFYVDTTTNSWNNFTITDLHVTLDKYHKNTATSTASQLMAFALYFTGTVSDIKNFSIDNVSLAVQRSMTTSDDWCTANIQVAGCYFGSAWSTMTNGSFSNIRLYSVNLRSPGNLDVLGVRFASAAGLTVEPLSLTFRDIAITDLDLKTLTAGTITVANIIYQGTLIDVSRIDAAGLTLSSAPGAVIEAGSDLLAVICKVTGSIDRTGAIGMSGVTVERFDAKSINSFVKVIGLQLVGLLYKLPAGISFSDFFVNTTATAGLGTCVVAMMEFSSLLQLTSDSTEIQLHNGTLLATGTSSNNDIEAFGIIFRNGATLMSRIHVHNVQMTSNLYRPSTTLDIVSGLIYFKSTVETVFRILVDGSSGINVTATRGSQHKVALVLFGVSGPQQLHELALNSSSIECDIGKDDASGVMHCAGVLMQQGWTTGVAGVTAVSASNITMSSRAASSNNLVKTAVLQLDGDFANIVEMSLSNVSVNCTHMESTDSEANCLGLSLSRGSSASIGSIPRLSLRDVSVASSCTTISSIDTTMCYTAAFRVHQSMSAMQLVQIDNINVECKAAAHRGAVNCIGVAFDMGTAGNGGAASAFTANNVYISAPEYLRTTSTESIAVVAVLFSAAVSNYRWLVLHGGGIFARGLRIDEDSSNGMTVIGLLFHNALTNIAAKVSMRNFSIDCESESSSGGAVSAGLLAVPFALSPPPPLIEGLGCSLRARMSSTGDEADATVHGFFFTDLTHSTSASFNLTFVDNSFDVATTTIGSGAATAHFSFIRINGLTKCDVLHIESTSGKAQVKSNNDANLAILSIESSVNSLQQLIISNSSLLAGTSVDGWYYSSVQIVRFMLTVTDIAQRLILTNSSILGASVKSGGGNAECVLLRAKLSFAMSEPAAVLTALELRDSDVNCVVHRTVGSGKAVAISAASFLGTLADVDRLRFTNVIVRGTVYGGADDYSTKLVVTVLHLRGGTSSASIGHIAFRNSQIVLRGTSSSPSQHTQPFEAVTVAVLWLSGQSKIEQLIAFTHGCAVDVANFSSNATNSSSSFALALIDKSIPFIGFGSDHVFNVNDSSVTAVFGPLPGAVVSVSLVTFQAQAEFPGGSGGVLAILRSLVNATFISGLPRNGLSVSLVNFSGLDVTAFTDTKFVIYDSVVYTALSSVAAPHVTTTVAVLQTNPAPEFVTMRRNSLYFGNVTTTAASSATAPDLLAVALYMQGATRTYEALSSGTQIQVVGAFEDNLVTGLPSVAAGEEATLCTQQTCSMLRLGDSIRTPANFSLIRNRILGGHHSSFLFCNDACLDGGSTATLYLKRNSNVGRIASMPESVPFDLYNNKFILECNEWPRVMEREWNVYAAAPRANTEYRNCTDGPRTDSMSLSMSHSVSATLTGSNTTLNLTTSSTTVTSTTSTTTTTTTTSATTEATSATTEVISTTPAPTLRTSATTTTTTTTTTPSTTTSTTDPPSPITTTATSAVPPTITIATTTTQAPPPPPPRPRTKTRERTLTPMPPTPEPKQIVEPGTSAMTTTSTALAVLSVNPAVGPLAVRAGLLSIGSSCGQELAPLDVATNPTRLEVESLLDYRYWAGAALGNAMLCAAFGTVVIAGVLQYQHLFNKKADRQLSVAVAIASTFWLVMSQPVIVGFIATATFTEVNNRMSRLNIAVGVWTILSTVLYPCFIFYRVHKELPLIHFKEEPLPKDANVFKKLIAYLFGSYKELEWGDPQCDLRIRWGWLFDHTSMMSLAVSEVVCGFAINVVLGTMQNPALTESECQVRSIVALIFHLPPTILSIGWRPFLSRFDMWTTPMMWLMNTVMSVLVVVKLFGSDIGVGLDAMGALVGVAGMIASLGLVFNAYDVAMRAIARKQKLKDEKHEALFREAAAAMTAGGGDAVQRRRSESPAALDVPLLVVPSTTASPNAAAPTTQGLVEPRHHHRLPPPKFQRSGQQQHHHRDDEQELLQVDLDDLDNNDIDIDLGFDLDAEMAELSNSGSNNKNGNDKDGSNGSSGRGDGDAGDLVV